jgi:hypothetical protein
VVLRRRFETCLVRDAASISVMKASITESSTASGAIPRRLAQWAKRDRPLRIRVSVFARSSVHASSSVTFAVLTIGRKPEASIAAARSLRMFAQRFRDTLACAATIPSRVSRISAKSSGMAPVVALSALRNTVRPIADRVCDSRKERGVRQADRGSFAG